MLAAYLEQCRARRFNWRGWNCVHFAIGWVDQVEGTSLLAEHYALATDTALAAVRLAASKGGLQEAVSRALARPPLPPLAANVGDVVLFGSGGAGILGICNGVSAATLHPAQGLLSAPMSGALCIWKVAENV